MKRQFSYGDALRVADQLKQDFALACERIEIAGAIRRRKETVSDIDFVLKPVCETDLFGEPTNRDEFTKLLSNMLGEGIFVWRKKTGEPVFDVDSGKQALALKWSRKYVPLVHKRSRVPVDVFIVRPPADFVWLLMIRTGSSDFSRDMVMRAKDIGYKCHDGAMWNTMNSLSFNCEEDVFDTLGWDYIPPQNR